MSRICCLITLFLWLNFMDPRSISAEHPQLAKQSFDQDPLWEGYRNRLLPDPFHLLVTKRLG